MSKREIPKAMHLSAHLSVVPIQVKVRLLKASSLTCLLMSPIQVTVRVAVTAHLEWSFVSLNPTTPSWRRFTFKTCSHTPTRQMSKSPQKVVLLFCLNPTIFHESWEPETCVEYLNYQFINFVTFSWQITSGVTLLSDNNLYLATVCMP